MMANTWFQELWRVVGIALFMLLLGWFIGHVFLLLFLTCLTYLGWHMYNLRRLEYWFISKKKEDLPDPPGIWGEVFYHFYRLQQRNRKRKRKLASILKSFQRSTAAMPDATVVLGSRFEIKWFNKAAQQILGLKPPYDKGQVISNFIRSPSFHDYLYEDIKENSSIIIESPVHPAIILRINIVPYSDNLHLLLARDVTHLHHLEQVRSDFIANISHEMRTPLTVVAGFIETMLDAEDDSLKQWERPLTLMSQQTTRIRCIVDDLLMLSRLESGPVKGLSSPINVKNLITNISEEAKALSGDKQHNFLLEISEELEICGYPDELRSAFSNLVFNAVQYTPAYGNITIRCFVDEKGVHFEVEDTGEGIAPEHIPRLTERFYRVDVSRSRSQGGTGLGLAIVKHVLNHHHGQLHIESELGKGSVFRCDFPITILACNPPESGIFT